MNLESVNNLNTGSKDKPSLLLWIAVVVISAVIIFLGHKIATNGLNVFLGNDGQHTIAHVEKILGGESSNNNSGNLGDFKVEEITFKAELLSGTDSGKSVIASQSLNGMFAGTSTIKPVEGGDKILLIKVKNAEAGWQFADYYRLDKILGLVAVFALLLIIFGGIKGVNTIVSLGFTFGFVFFVFVPWVMNGYNIYIGIVATCVFTIVMTLILINGVSKKSFVTMLGCILGTLVAALITLGMHRILQLTGFIDEHSVYLTMLNPSRPIDLVGTVFSAIIIGALGAIMDVAMDISSSMYELAQQVEGISFSKLVKSGLRIGSDLMGTMSNTLVLAYIGGSFCSIMLLVTYSSSMMGLLNREIIIVEMLQALIGSISVLLTVPLTALISAYIYLKNTRN